MGDLVNEIMNDQRLQGSEDGMRRSFVRSCQVSTCVLTRAYVHMLAVLHPGRLLDTARR